MEPTISIPPGWQYPRFGFGQRTERGQIIGMKYYAEDTYLAEEYGAGWRYILLPNKNTEDDETRIEDDIKLLSVQELKTVLETEIINHLRQVESLKYELKAVGVSFVASNSTVEESKEPPYPSLHDLVDAGKFILKEIAKHPDYLTLRYQPDLTIGDAETALSYLELELEPNQSPALDIAD
ncbi:hypothetical protein H6G80_34890 [Nostoc sp. FACHB-87]|uniref:hypothetical protein n=1 Tax=Nostocaceae TaxID=1162 RepID=UPI0016847A88|nr:MULTISPECIES: hypothetical protein [Nostocaceae]MBD2459211.1 hypothetical protein [Nostoc sp. FACHB-87]MBD2480237.1 hypothetical protein [Anabaena sp. FACHB-83]